MIDDVPDAESMGRWSAPSVDYLAVDDLEAYIAVAVIEWSYAPVNGLDCGCTEISRHIAHSLLTRLGSFAEQEP